MPTPADLQARRERIVLDHFADETRQDFDAVLHTFPHPHHEIIQLRHAEDVVVVEFWLLGTHRGALKGIPATDNTFSCRMVAFFIFEGDTLVCKRPYFDSLTLLKQLLAGVPPAAPPALVGGLLA